MLKKRKRNQLRYAIYSTLLVAAFVAGAYRMNHPTKEMNPLLPGSQQPTATAKAGDVMGIDSVQPFTQVQAEAIARQNYGASTLPVTTSVTKVSFRYRSSVPGGKFITIHARAYLPESPQTNLPVYAFAPGTTGIGDVCAASLENVKLANWANYDSHMVMYASQGMATVTTDYEGMRDAGRIHHYMVGELEGRAVLDSVRALAKLPQAKDRLAIANLFVGGYSQGGHAALWADKIVQRYAPELKIKGVIGYGPVMSVKQTLADVTRGANINWFGPYVLYSYHDNYNTTYPLDQILVPHVAANLNKDVPTHCIDTDIAHWGHNPAGVYTPEFLQVLSSGVWSGQYAELGRQLDANEVGSDSSGSAKRINTGALDNVVLASQQTAGSNQLCTSSAGPVMQVVYPRATHYDTMVQSLSDTLAWMRQVTGPEPPPSACPNL